MSLLLRCWPASLRRWGLPDSLIAGTPCAESDLICLQLPKCIWLAQDMPAADSLLLQQLAIQEDVALIKWSDCFCADTVDSALRNRPKFFRGKKNPSISCMGVRAHFQQCERSSVSFEGVLSPRSWGDTCLNQNCLQWTSSHSVSQPVATNGWSNQCRFLVVCSWGRICVRRWIISSNDPERLDE